MRVRARARVRIRVRIRVRVRVRARARARVRIRVRVPRVPMTVETPLSVPRCLWASRVTSTGVVCPG